MSNGLYLRKGEKEMAYEVTDKVIKRDARIIFRNFRGEESKFNRKGSRNFSVIISDQEEADFLMEQGWNIKTLKPRDEDEDPRYSMQVAVNFDINPPEVHLITSKSDTLLGEDTIDILDYADIVRVDLTVRPYNWEVNGKKGVKGYLKTMYVTVEENEFADEYTDKF